MLAKAIIKLEWDMMDKVNNVGGRADCQDDFETFRAMRENQLSVWDDDMKQSYLNDLQLAAQNGRNLLSEKYGYMMESSVPEEFAKIAHLLPAVSEEKRHLVDSIVKTQVQWQLDMAGEYPRLASRGRSIRASEDTPWNTSFETYLRGELCTYSVRTLRLYQRRVDEMLAAGGNLNMDVMKHTVAAYGYNSLAQAEAALAD